MSATKARRLVADGRCHIPDVSRVVVDGDTGRWEVWLEDGHFACSCDGFLYRRVCSHVEAVGLLTAPPPARWSRPARTAKCSASSDRTEPNPVGRTARVTLE